MEEITRFNVVCPFCGKERQGKTISEDGYDWEGHKRGREFSETIIEKCSCAFGQLVGTMPHIKHMCKNCYHYVNGYCTNPREIAEIKKLIGNFDVVVNKFSVKNPYVSCSKYELNYGIFDDLFDEKKKERGKRTT